MTDENTPGQPHAQDHYNGARVILKVPRAHVKAVKLALESRNLFDRCHGISPDPEDDPAQEPRMRVPTLIPCTQVGDNSQADTPSVDSKLHDLHLEHITPAITYSSFTPSPSPTHTQNLLRKALHEALSQPPTTAFLSSQHLSIPALTAAFPDTYSIYTPLLLLPSTSLRHPWPTLLSSPALEPLWSHIAAALNCTHIALNAPIPAAHAASSAHAKDTQNLLRSPANLTPVWGTFGPAPSTHSLAAPSPKDFKDALWVCVTQNGIRQTWAPRYTMFSRGNVKEKARILNLARGDEDAGRKGLEATAVDMYAGIGYFAFSYARLGCTVLCFEINPWSTEGLRRGAAMNGWSARVFTVDDVPGTNAGSSSSEKQKEDAAWSTWLSSLHPYPQILIFAMSNTHAAPIVARLRAFLPPVLHVNLGLLPDSRLSWPGAVSVLDARGGCVRAHENVGVKEVEARTGEVGASFQRLVDLRNDMARRTAKVVHVERVKMYAPGVVHAVFDVSVSGT